MSAPLTIHESAGWQRRRQWLHEYFDRTAVKAWEALTSDQQVSKIRQTVREGRDQMRSTLLGWLPADLSGMRVLDAGCGPGMAAIELARRGATVVAVDLSPTLVDLAKERYGHDEALSRVTWFAGDMLDPALGEFDYALAMDSLIHYDEPELRGALRSFGARVHRGMVFTYAPATPLLSTLHAVGKFFPRRDRAPRIQPISRGAVSWGVERDTEMSRMGWRVGRTRRVSRGFYTSQALEILRSPAVAG